MPLCQGECLISQADGDIQFSAKSGHVFAQCVDLCGADVAVLDAGYPALPDVRQRSHLTWVSD